MEGQYASINDKNEPNFICTMNSYETANVIFDLNFLEENLGRDWWHAAPTREAPAVVAGPHVPHPLGC